MYLPDNPPDEIRVQGEDRSPERECIEEAAGNNRRTLRKRDDQAGRSRYHLLCYGLRNRSGHVRDMGGRNALQSHCIFQLVAGSENQQFLLWRKVADETLDLLVRFESAENDEVLPLQVKGRRYCNRLILNRVERVRAVDPARGAARHPNGQPLCRMRARSGR